jgi:hypothetical protein
MFVPEPVKGKRIDVDRRQGGVERRLGRRLGPLFRHAPDTRR